MKTYILQIKGSDGGAPKFTVQLYELQEGQIDPTPIEASETEFSIQVQDEDQNPLSLDELVERFEKEREQTSLWQQVGNKLYAAITQGKISAALRAIPPNSRVMLHIEDQKLQRLPWELLNKERRYLLGNKQQPWSRLQRDDLTSLGIQPDWMSAGDNWPLRVLIFLSAPDEEDEPEAFESAGNQVIYGQQELLRILYALSPSNEYVECDADFDIWFLKRQDKVFLLEKLREIKPHVLHFIGHAYAGRAGSDSALILHLPNAGETEAWTSSEIVNDLQDITSLRLAFLNACETDVSADGAWAISQSFIDAGVPAVLSMRADVTGQNSLTFAETFYKSLALKNSLDVAVEQGRKAVRDRPGELEKRDWAVPCLQVTALPEHILTVGSGVDPTRREQIKSYPDFRPLRFCVDRSNERHKSWRKLTEDGPGVLVLKGAPEVGKTTVAQQVLERCALMGRQVRYMDISKLGFLHKDQPNRALNLLQALRLGWKDPDLPRLSEPLEPQSAFVDFDRLTGGYRSFESIKLENPQKANPDQTTSDVYTAFRAGLEACALQGKGLVLMFDHLSRGYENFHKNEFEELKVNLFEYYGRYPNPNIRLVLVVNENDYLYYEIDRISGIAPLDIPWMPGEQLIELILSYIYRSLSIFNPPETELSKVFANVRTIAGELQSVTEIDPYYFESMVEIIRSSKKYPWIARRRG